MSEPKRLVKRKKRVTRLTPEARGRINDICNYSEHRRQEYFNRDNLVISHSSGPPYKRSDIVPKNSFYTKPGETSKVCRLDRASTLRAAGIYVQNS